MISIIWLVKHCFASELIVPLFIPMNDVCYTNPAHPTLFPSLEEEPLYLQLIYTLTLLSCFIQENCLANLQFSFCTIAENFHYILLHWELLKKNAISGKRKLSKHPEIFNYVPCSHINYVPCNHILPLETPVNFPCRECFDLRYLHFIYHIL